MKSREEIRLHYILPYSELTSPQHVHSDTRFVNYATTEKLAVSVTYYQGSYLFKKKQQEEGYQPQNIVTQVLLRYVCK